MSFFRFIYFTKGEKIAITFLLVLIIISGIIFLVTRNDRVDVDVRTLQEDAKFKEFQSSLTNSDSSLGKDFFNKSYILQKTEETKYTNYIKKLSTGEVIDLNEADTTQLKQIPNIGSSFASRIVKYRTLLGGYADINQLKEVWGIDNYLFENINSFIILQKKNEKININEVSFDELVRHPYINYKQASIIVDIRGRKGSIESIEHLSLLDEFSEKDIVRLKPYLAF